ncbi:hypothetical protein A374_10525 [Fictibacillus macauensis ZFHKF-1]|uniref:Aminodeoxychorismate lyase n=1 Tax=Fictibacillus macauensis ZFHKF-1 TaxID=1196324 RepID=I8J0A3_9BACL|nr:hypothetical protein [Fictibacillus macauensis]EIT85171.1 hypothetical protein A374_10525 [Fictibacillus macauensis ZFHKF-1]
MTNQTLRGLAAGFILSAGVMAAVYYTQPKTTDDKALNANNVNDYLHAKGMTAVTNDELEKLKANPAPQPTATKPAEKEKETKKIYTAKVKVSKGMSSGEVIDFLKEKKIITDTKGFADYLEKHKLEGDIKFGSHKVSSDMTFKKLAEAITSY